MTSTNEAASHQKVTQTQKEFAFALQTSASVQISRFQRIGCFLRVVGGIKAVDTAEGLFEQKYAFDYLTSIEGFDSAVANKLMHKGTFIKELFETVWSHIDDFEKSVALWLNYEISCNYWPYWDIYNQAFLPYLKLSSGSPEDIIGSPAQIVPHTMIGKRNTSSANPEEFEPVPPIEEGFPHVFAEHNCWEVSSRDGYFAIPQQAHVILKSLDEVYEDAVNQEEARDLLQKRLKFSSELIEALIIERKWPRRFSILWESLSDRLKSDLIAEDWTWYDSYWPGLEFYNETLCAIMQLPSGKPADIFGTPYHPVPQVS